MKAFALLICASLARLEVEANGLDDMKHVIIFMQENRPFDHYFGTLKGVRGFNDRTTVPLTSGLNAFYQPVKDGNLLFYCFNQSILFFIIL